MRAAVVALPLALIALPATAAPAPELPRELSDPAMADKLGKVAGALTKALMDMPVGEVEAAVEGREPTAADRDRRVRDAIGGPDAERQVEAKATQSGRMMQAGAQAMIKALPGIMKALDGVEAEIDRAVSNIPDPTYPKR
ncbi:hypothetical protein [Sphingomonas jaspsi]|uniref:hypothetical protein n=1 Tax=Sphingomonas jaspsi TaxID=392409 RepID=UPI0004B13FF3|nr:hypothetical protein [Sphingomonas jaspsi]